MNEIAELSGYAGVDDTGLKGRLDLTETEITCYNTQRINLTLRAQGINPASLSSLERAQIEMALAFDADAFPDQEGGVPATLQRFYKSRGIADAVVLSKEEIEEVRRTIKGLPAEEQAALEDTKKNLQSAIHVIGGMVAQGSSSLDIEAELSNFLIATPERGQVSARYHLARPFQPEIDSSMMPRAVEAGLSPFLLSLADEVTGHMQNTLNANTEVQGIPGSWVAQLERDYQEQKARQQSNAPTGPAVKSRGWALN